MRVENEIEKLISSQTTCTIMDKLRNPPNGSYGASMVEEERELKWQYDSCTIFGRGRINESLITFKIDLYLFLYELFPLPRTFLYPV